MDDPEKTLRSLLDTIPKERQPDALAAVTRVLEDWAGPTPTLTAPALDALAQQQPGTWVDRTAKAHHPAPEQSLPKKAPALWEEDAQEGERITDFITRHYGPWMKPDNTGITISDIGRLDPPARTKLRNHMRRHTLPDDFHLPTREEKNDALLAQVKAGEPLPDGYNERMRLMRAASNKGISLRR